ncbi:imidazoleglycerol-phosphate dehydratase HisB [Methanohalophilus portucalensis]|uniref:Imidazoleglycerol-phosphate dehydratase n=2 Tax=Methanohalophilus portucalensis TaxID=39664 RepID=A0A1L9C396_9EURY|nr:imidazoleglycerol-phosphate dehydratase HisB [Methanohalophilus portucalensis]ATU07589.1 imidazoleglycerol-phosphate dehydratase [Methanohalophilus portucalensis]OJH48933.1 imidazoleglycerol-phosphate dehydratase [Methanohalophilus portucalensis FDF-1]RNI10315.1 imidazoleglycerol-phosphate dehydratase HisB [Methanohalophilus portucalensis FDF-1]SMH37717.1 imidazoleglycerol-phosphate dehydratase [Methanohalophilus portucalensis FDF-1]
MPRISTVSRTTRETSIELTINIDGKGDSQINTGIGFFDHMLVCFARHSGFDLTIDAKGDLEVDGHHLVEDIGIVMGQAFDRIMAEKSGIARFGESRIPMDEALASVVVDIGGRSYLVMDTTFESEKVGEFNTQLTRHFFESFVSNAKVTLHATVYGYNDHHKIEALFKAFAQAMKKATVIEGKGVKSTKGCL